MKKLALMTVALAMMVAAPALAEDIYPPDWRGDERSTYQRWEFNDDNPIPLPDEVMNPFGMPQMVVTPYAPWMPEFGDPISRPGVWPLSGMIEVEVPNNQPDEYKLIRVQVTWAEQQEGSGIEPIITVAIPVQGEVQEADRLTTCVGYPWQHTVVDFFVIPNPEWETISIFGEVNVDEVVIDTICIPEPGTMLLLAVGGVSALLRRRRK